MTRQVEPEWDDHTRSLAEGLAGFERDRCPGCGLHHSILDRPDRNRFTFEEEVCEVCKGQDIHNRALADRDRQADKALENAPAAVPRPGDGRHVYLRRMTADEIEAAETRKREP